MKKEPLVVIVILNFNGFEDTVSCIKSLEKIRYRNYRILIVDNGSKDHSVRRLASLFPKIQIVENTDNLGYSGGNNSAFPFVLSQNPKYVLFLNNDTIVDKDFLGALVEGIELKSRKIGIVGPKIYYHHKKDYIWSVGGKINYKKGAFESIGINEPDRKQYENVSQVEYISGCCLLIRTTLLKKYGGFDDDYFAYVEDVDLNLKMKKQGYKSFYIPTSLIWHKVSSSTGGEGNSIKNYYKTRNTVIFATKNLQSEIKRPFLYSFFKTKLLELLYFIKNKKYKHFTSTVSGLIDGLRYRKKKPNDAQFV